MSFQIQKALIMYIKEYADLHVVMDEQNDTDDHKESKLNRGYKL